MNVLGWFPSYEEIYSSGKRSESETTSDGGSWSRFPGEYSTRNEPSGQSVIYIIFSAILEARET